MALTRIFDISRRSLSTYQNSMNVAAHNIANAANKDYSRQRVQLTTETPERAASFLWGSGVKIDTIERVRDELIEKQIISNQYSYSGNEKRSMVLSQVEQIFTEPSDLGVSNLMNSFFNSWNQLAVTPNSLPLRNDVINTAKNLASKVGNINKDIDIIKYDIFTEMQEKVNSLNYYLKEINSLNRQINKYAGTNQSANDLLDSRDKMINELAKLANVSVTYDNNDNAAISIGSIFAVDASAYIEFEVVNENGNLLIGPKNSSNTVNLKGGELFALSDMYSNTIPKYQNYIDELFTQFVTSINSVHNNGFTIEAAPRTGIDFFKEYKDGVLVIDNEILADARNIAASADGTNGNGDIAIQIAELASSSTEVNNTSFEAYYNSLISEIGNDKVSSDRMAEASKMVVEQLENQRASISGVSVDEEMTEIIKYQRSYEASAKLIRVADEMLEIIMNLV